jgi:hypothetical protein
MAASMRPCGPVVALSLGHLEGTRSPRKKEVVQCEEPTASTRTEQQGPVFSQPPQPPGTGGRHRVLPRGQASVAWTLPRVSGHKGPSPRPVPGALTVLDLGLWPHTATTGSPRTEVVRLRQRCTVKSGSGPVSPWTGDFTRPSLCVPRFQVG